jgi:hypothetical protein
MSAYLINRHGDSLQFNHFTWAMVLSLAKDYGWKPDGTVDPWWKDEPDAPDWDGNYVTNDHQQVTSDDALNVANALRRAIEDMDGTSEKVSEGFAIAADFNCVVQGMEELESLLGPGASLAKGHIDKQLLKEFIQFCRKGSFCIS